MVEWIPQLPSVGVPKMPTQYGRPPLVTHTPAPTPTPMDATIADIMTRAFLDLIVVGVIVLIFLGFAFLWWRNRSVGGW